MPFIYLSYRTGDDGGYVESFVRELGDAIERAAPTPRSSTTYRASDDSVLGSVWQPAAATAMAESTVYVAICSERYFLTERAGREWWSFVERCTQHEAATGRRPRPVIPLCWGYEGSPDRLPGGRYVSNVGWGADLRSLSRLLAHRGRYEQLIDRIAHHIVDESRDPLRRAVTVLPYGATPNAFGIGPASRIGAVPAPAQSVCFVVLAGSRDQMAQVRNDGGRYGDSPADWRPYAPATPSPAPSGPTTSSVSATFGPAASEPIARRAQAVAADHLFHSYVVDDAEPTTDAVDRAVARDHLVVLIVDPWAVRLDRYRQVLTEIDRLGGDAVSVLVPMSSDDPETVRNSAQLGPGVTRILRRRGHDPAVWVGPHNQEQFDEALGRILEAARYATYRTAPVRRSGPGPAPQMLPVLEAP